MNKYFSITAYYFNGDVDLFWFSIFFYSSARKRRKITNLFIYDFEWLSKYVKTKHVSMQI